MLAISAEKVNDPRETGVVPGTEGFKIDYHVVRWGAFAAADTLELTSWKITFNVANLRSWRKSERLVMPGVIFQTSDIG
jgi:hypothetical protein